MLIRRAQLSTVVCASSVVLAAVTGAFATSLGSVTTQTLGAFDAGASNLAPGVITCDDFARTAATGSALANRPVQLPANCGAFTWTSHLGTWTITSGQLGAATANATATMSAAGQTDISAQATILNANGSGRIGGVAIDHTGASRIYLVGALSGPSTAQLRLVNGASVTTLASAAATIGASCVVRVTRNGTAVTVSVNGTALINFTLTSGQVTTLAGGTKVGLYWSAGTTLRFTDVLATEPASP